MKKINGFELLESRFIKELNTKARLFRHAKSHAQLLSLENDDDNKVFGITFKTPPRDSTGIAHIMEHSVLCGSRKYPVREPFVELMKGSLNTFLNAFTYPDKTCYPVASQNLQDFYNLIDVYLDAVFYPLLTPFTFQQEAWHYELDKVDAPLDYKGVVYNEMKGNYSSSDNLINEKSQQSLFPDNTYCFDSGGDPRHIPDLTYDQFKAFHDAYYHPSNAYIYFYGDDEPEERLRVLGEYLKDFEPQALDTRVLVQPHLEQQPRLVIPYAASESQVENKAYVSVNFLLPEILDPRMALSFTILGEILIGTPASPLRKALIDSGLGEDLTGAGFESDLRQMFFSTGLKGIDLEEADQVEKLILETLESLTESGIDRGTVEAALNTVEFRLRENNTGRFPQGLLLMTRSLKTWLHGGDPFALLAFEGPLNWVKDQVGDGNPYFEELIQKNFLTNPHRTTVILKPDIEEAERWEQFERERLSQVRAQMSDEQLQAIVINTQELKRRQETPDPPEALQTIPVLALSDLDKSIKTIPCEEVEQGNMKILYHDLFTNGICYLDLGFNLRALQPDLLPFVPLLGRSFLEMGTEEEDFVKLSQHIGRSTGGIYSTSFTSMRLDSDQPEAWLFLRGKATFTQTGDLLAILKDVLLRVRLDNPERFRQILLEVKSNLEQQLLPMGHRVINGRLRSYFNPADWAAEQMGGIDYLFFLRQINETIQKDWPEVLYKLEATRQQLLNRQNMVFNLTLDETNWRSLKPSFDAFIGHLPSKPIQEIEWNQGRFANLEEGTKQSRVTYEGLTLPSQINYVGKGGNLYSLSYEYHGSMAVIMNYLRSTWIWEKVRVQGGAYGGFSVFDQRSGVFTLLSYRDPNLLDTLKVYDHTGEFLNQLEISQEELEKSIIGAIGEMDAHQLPDAKGYTSLQRYLVGVSDDYRQLRRDQIFSTNIDHFHSLGEVLTRWVGRSRVVVLGSEKAIGELKSAHKDAVEVVRIL